MLDNSADSTLFVGRARELRILDSALTQNLNCLVAGDSGIGKTSLLRHEMHRLRNGSVPGEYRTTYVQAQGLTDPLDLLVEITRAALGTTSAPSGSAISLLTALRSHRDKVATVDGPGTTVVLLVDDVGANVGHALFGRFRDRLWELGYVWIVATRERGRLLVPPADAFFERVVEIEPLTPQESIALLQARRAGPLTDWSEPVARIVGGNPRRVLAFVRDFLAGGEGVKQLSQSLALREDAIRRLGRSEAMLATELMALGSASSSDKALLDRLGWTRPRAVQIFQRLEESGLVRSETVSSGPGRPRKVYRITSPSEYAEWMSNEGDDE